MHNMSKVDIGTIIYYARINAKLNVSRRRVIWTQNRITYFFSAETSKPSTMYNIIVKYDITLIFKQNRRRTKNSSLGEYNDLFINYKVV